MNKNKLFSVIVFFFVFFLLMLMKSGAVTGWLFGAMVALSSGLSVWFWGRKS